MGNLDSGKHANASGPADSSQSAEAGRSTSQADPKLPADNAASSQYAMKDGMTAKPNLYRRNEAPRSEGREAPARSARRARGPRIRAARAGLASFPGASRVARSGDRAE